jgi:hypothetical protein
VSDDSVTFVSVDPQYVPTAEQVKDAESLARSLFPQADAVSPQHSDGIRLFDAGGNLESITCPGCGAEIELSWWQQAMDADSTGDRFRLRPQVMQCCNRSYTLDQLDYQWPQAFGKFGLELMNPNVGSVPAESVAALETVLGTSLRVIHAHL